MKITKNTLKQLIKEELMKELGDREFEDDEDLEREREEAEREDGQWPGPNFNDKEEAVRVMALELAEALAQMGDSNPELTDHYIMIMRALRDAGVRLEALVQMA